MRKYLVSGSCRGLSWVFDCCHANENLSPGFFFSFSFAFCARTMTNEPYNSKPFIFIFKFIGRCHEHYQIICLLSAVFDRTP